MPCIGLPEVDGGLGEMEVSGVLCALGLGGSKGEVLELGAASGRGEGEARSLCWGFAVSYFPFWSLFRVLYGVFLCRSCLVEQTCIYFQCKIL